MHNQHPFKHLEYLDAVFVRMGLPGCVGWLMADINLAMVIFVNAMANNRLAFNRLEQHCMLFVGARFNQSFQRVYIASYDFKFLG